MQNALLCMVGAIVVITGMTPLAPLAAKGNDDTGWRHGYEKHIERMHERLERQREKMENRHVKLEERLDRMRERVERRRERMEDRTCRRLERLRDRSWWGGSLPSFCGGDDSDTDTKAPRLTLTASPLSIEAGASSTLTWESSHAESCTASGGWSGEKSLDGTLSVKPSVTTSYTLRCENDHGDVQKIATVTVVTPGPMVNLSVDDATIQSGEATTLRWVTERAKTCLASGGWSGERATSGALIISPTATTTYTLLCGNGTATDTDSAVVDVRPFVPAPLPTVDLSASPLSVTPGATSTLSWTSTNAVSCTALGGWSGAKAIAGMLDVVVNATTSYTLECINISGTATDTVEVVVVPDIAATSDVILNEVAWMGTSVSANDEWIELYNRGSAPQDLTGWTIVAGDGTPSISLSGTIGAGAYYLLERTDDDTVPTQSANLIYSGALGDSGEVLNLKNADTVTIDTVNGSSNWSIGGNSTTKETLQRSADGSWFTALGTPKAENVGGPN